MMHFHLLHLVRIEFLLDLLRQRWCQVVAGRGFRPSIVSARAKCVINAQIRRKRNPFR